jgi:3-isopropylmalate dehydrogenase
MLLRHSLHLENEALCIEEGVSEVLDAGHRTRDLAKPGQPALSTQEMGAKVRQACSERTKNKHSVEA